MANTFGHLFRITTWGESHGGGVGVVVDGCPPRLALTEADIQPDLDRRRPGQSKIVSPRKEADKVQILSGTFKGKTLGTPISLWVKNEDARPEAYTEMATKFRPSHADYTYQAKFGIRSWPGGGRTIARGVPAGWGEPVFDRLEADLAKAMLSLPASKGFDVGSGFDGILLRGTEHNDAFRAKGGKVFTKTNRSGGIQGGISNGQTIYFRVAFKPVATVMQVQDTVDIHLQNTTLKARGRHDPCVLPRAVPMVEAMTALVLADHALRHRAQCE